jgi:hypothetical protein
MEKKKKNPDIGNKTNPGNTAHKQVTKNEKQTTPFHGQETDISSLGHNEVYRAGRGIKKKEEGN